MGKRKFKFNTRWDGDNLICACLFGNPCCDRFKKCEVQYLTHDPYEDIEQVMKERSYKKVKGSYRQVRND